MDLKNTRILGILGKINFGDKLKVFLPFDCATKATKDPLN